MRLMFEAAFNGDDDASSRILNDFNDHFNHNETKRIFVDETIDYLFFSVFFGCCVCLFVCLFGACLFVCLRIHDLFAQVLFRSHIKSCM